MNMIEFDKDYVYLFFYYNIYNDILLKRYLK